eukprot:4154295-Pleurochrysis_carterae.AAC.2
MPSGGGRGKTGKSIRRTKEGIRADWHLLENRCSTALRESVPAQANLMKRRQPSRDANDPWAIRPIAPAPPLQSG